LSAMCALPSVIGAETGGEYGGMSGGHSLNQIIGGHHAPNNLVEDNIATNIMQICTIMHDVLCKISKFSRW